MAQDSEPSLGALFSNASRDLSALVQSEVALAKSELREDVKRGAVGGGALAVAGALAFVALIMLSVAAAYGLVALGLHPAWAFLIVGGVYLLIAGALGLLAKSLLTRMGPPHRTIRSSKETAVFLKSRRSHAETPSRR
jgi:uncharacterized membrane protein YqjE